MQDLLENYVVDQVFQVITSGKRIPWPDYFTADTKVGFLDNMLARLQEKGDYDKCKRILSIKKNVEKRRI